ncbi:MAG: FeoA family protein [archaeon]
MATESIVSKVPLTSIKPGEKAVIKQIHGGVAATQRLTDMGLTIGTEIEVTKCAPFLGPVCIRVRNSCLAIGYGLASKISVVKKLERKKA